MKASDPARGTSRFRAVALARATLIYGLLLGGSCVFAMPFLWMAGTSFKVDREIFGKKLTIGPSAPVPRRVSPYAAPADSSLREQDPSGEVLRRIMASAPRLKHVSDHVRPEEWAASLEPVLSGRIASQLPPAKVRDAQAWRDAAERVCTESGIAEEAERQLREIRWGALRVRSRELEESDLTEDQVMSSFFTRRGAPSECSDGVEGGRPVARLASDFRNTKGETPILLQRMLELPFDGDRLDKILWYFRSDESWARLDFEVERGGRKLASTRPEYLASAAWSVITLREWGPADRFDSTEPKTWIPLREIARGPAYDFGPRKARLTIRLAPSSRAGAWGAKLLRNYRLALAQVPFWRYTATSLFLVIANIVGTLLSCSLVAFAFARLRWMGRGACFALMMATMMIPSQITMIPYFLIVKWLGWYNTLTPLWAVSFFGNAFNIFLLVQFMRGIPRDLEDAARMDGCNSLQVWWHIMLPLMKPTLACIAIFTFMGVWNDFMGPLIYLSDQRLYPLSLGLFAFNQQLVGSQSVMMSGALLMTVPVIVIFFFAQKYFIQGVTLTGMK